MPTRAKHNWTVPGCQAHPDNIVIKRHGRHRDVKTMLSLPEYHRVEQWCWRTAPRQVFEPFENTVTLGSEPCQSGRHGRGRYPDPRGWEDGLSAGC